MVYTKKVKFATYQLQRGHRIHWYVKMEAFSTCVNDCVQRRHVTRRLWAQSARFRPRVSRLVIESLWQNQPPIPGSPSYSFCGCLRGSCVFSAMLAITYTGSKPLGLIPGCSLSSRSPLAGKECVAECVMEC